MNRADAIAGVLDAKRIDGLLITDITNVRYVSGFTGSSAAVLVTKDKRFFFTDFRYQEQCERETRGFEIFIEREERPKLILEKARSAGVKILGFESTESYGFYRSLLRKGIVIKAVTNVVEDLRIVKDSGELRAIKRAVARAEKALSETVPFIKKGSSEKNIAGVLEEKLKKNGCRVLPFDIIIASGPNSSMPHAKPTDRKVQAGDLVVVDWGGEADGYYSDMTRTFLINGKSLAKKKEIYEIVLRANIESIESVRAGIHVRDVDKAARDLIRRSGYGDYFGHGTGHGVGLEVHELPRISRLGRNGVKQGMVFTIEPGIYLPGTGGVRIEDMVVAGKERCTVLTSLPKELEILN